MLLVVLTTLLVLSIQCSAGPMENEDIRELLRALKKEMTYDEPEPPVPSESQSEEMDKKGKVNPT